MITNCEDNMNLQYVVSYSLSQKMLTRQKAAMISRKKDILSLKMIIAVCHEGVHKYEHLRRQRITDHVLPLYVCIYIYTHTYCSV